VVHVRSIITPVQIKVNFNVLNLSSLSHFSFTFHPPLILADTLQRGGGGRAFSNIPIHLCVRSCSQIEDELPKVAKGLWDEEEGGVLVHGGATERRNLGI
jgi:hypothetical protein